MKVRYVEGWAAHVLAAQPWVRGVRTFDAAGIADKPVGLVIAPAAGGQPVRIQFVRASPSVSAPGDQPEEWSADDAEPVVPVEVSPREAKGWASAVASALAAAGHPSVKGVETFDAWGKSAKPAGVRVEFVDGAEVFGTVLDVR